MEVPALGVVRIGRIDHAVGIGLHLREVATALHLALARGLAIDGEQILRGRRRGRPFGGETILRGVTRLEGLGSGYRLSDPLDVDIVDEDRGLGIGHKLKARGLESPLVGGEGEGLPFTGQVVVATLVVDQVFAREEDQVECLRSFRGRGLGSETGTERQCHLARHVAGRGVEKPAVLDGNSATSGIEALAAPSPVGEFATVRTQEGGILEVAQVVDQLLAIGLLFRSGRKTREVFVDEHRGLLGVVALGLGSSLHRSLGQEMQSWGKRTCSLRHGARRTQRRGGEQRSHQ